MTLKEAAKQALGALEVAGYGKSYVAIDLREALAQQQGKWVDLTDDDLMELLCEIAASNGVNDSAFARAVIAKFKEKQL